LDGRRFLVLRLDGQNQTRARVGWSKIDLFLHKTSTPFPWTMVVSYFVTRSGVRNKISRARWCHGLLIRRSV
jgi:hypothetical protein